MMFNGYIVLLYRSARAAAGPVSLLHDLRNVADIGGEGHDPFQ